MPARGRHDRFGRPRTALALAVAVALAPVAACRRKPPPGPAATAPAPASVAAGGAEAPGEGAGPEADEAPVVVSARGQVERGGGGGGGGRAAAATGPLRDGDLLVTGADGAAVVRLPDGREIEVRSNARVRLKRDAPDEDGRPGLALEVEQGAIVSRTPGAGAGPAGAGRRRPVTLSILTPFGVTRVPATAHEARLDVRRDRASLEVAVGEVAFVHKSGRRAIARASENVEVTLGGVQIVRGARAPAPAAGGEAPAELAPAEGAPRGTDRPRPEVRVVMGAPLEILLSADRGKLLVRRPGESGFAARRAAPAAPGTSFQVPSDGRGRLVADGFVARLGPGARGRLGEAARGEEGDRVALTLDRGAATITTAGGRAREVRLTAGGRQLALRTPGAATVAVNVGRRGPEVEVLAGEADLSAAGRTERLAPATMAEVGRSDVKVSKRAAEDVILPTARGLRVFADRLERVTLTWDRGLKDARVEVASDPEFNEVILAGAAGGASQVTVPVPRRGDLYWRVTGGSAEGRERVAVGHARFVPDRRRSVLDLEHPHNVVPENAETTRVYFQGVLPALTFTFAAAPGASRFRVRVYREGELGKPLVDREVSEARCAVEAGVVKEGRYVWSAAPLDRGGREIGGGRMNKLELVYDNSLSTLAIGSPKPGQVITGREVAVSGVAPLGSRLYVNGRAAPLDDKGRFEMRVAPAEALVFRLVGKNGAESYFVRKLKVRS
jgi:hypothetical protein